MIMMLDSLDFILEVSPYAMTADQAGYTSSAFAISALIGMLATALCLIG